VHKILAIGGYEEIEERVEGLAKVGVTHFVFGDLLAPRTVKKTLPKLQKIIRKLGSANK